ncbi:MFS transporter [Sphingomonas sp. RS2018]
MATIPAPGQSVGPAATRPLVALFALALTMAVGFTTMTSFGTVQEAAKAELSLTDYNLSLIQGLSAAIPLALFSIPIGILVDRTNRVRLMLILAGLWTAGTLLTGFAGSGPILFVARMLAGIGATGALTAALSLAADFCRPEQRGRALLIVSVGKMLGTAAAFAVTGALYGLFVQGAIDPIGTLSAWRATHVVLAVIALLLVMPVGLLREPQRREVVSSTHAPARQIVAELWQRRVFLIPLFIGQVSVVMADAAANIWAAPVLSRSYGLKPEQFSGWMGAVLLGAGIGGAVLGGLAADLGQKSGRRGGLLYGAILAAALGVPAAAFPVMPDVTGFAIAFGLLMLCGTVTGLITSVSLTVLIPNELRGLCIGAFIAFAGIIGFGIAPTLVAALSDVLGGEAKIGEALSIVGIGVSIASVVAFAVAARHAPTSATAQPI